MPIYLIRFICILTIVFCCKFAFAGNVVVLIYHKIGDPRTPSTNVSVEKFKHQMKYLKTHNYQIIHLKKLVSLLENHKTLPENGVVITIDDGYKSVYTNAFPILRAYRYPFTVFLPTEAIEKGYPAYMSWNEIGTMRNWGADFQSHSNAHHHMAFIPSNMNEKTYRKWIRNDLQKSIDIFQNRLGYKPGIFAIPYGEYNKILIEEALKIGFKTLLTQDPGAVDENTPLDLIPREPILGKSWSTMSHFKKVLNHINLPVTKHFPDIGILKNRISIIGARLKYPDNYKNIRIYVSETGWHKAKLDKEGQVYIKNNYKLKRKINRIGVAGYDKNTGKEAVNFWMIIRK